MPFRPTIMGTHGMVATEHYLSALIGVEVLKRGGNAVDAAVAATFAEGVVNPHMHTIGGEVPMLIYRADSGQVSAINGNTAAPQLAQQLGIDYLGGDTGGSIMLAVIAAVAFATILAVVAGLTLASSSSLAHDFYASVIKRGTASEREEVRVARISALLIGCSGVSSCSRARNASRCSCESHWPRFIPSSCSGAQCR